MISANGPRKPNYPLLLIHPLGPLFRHLPLSLRRHLLYLRAYGRWGNFNQPERWTEKMQWRIINDRRLLLGVASDKLASKDFVRQTAQSAGITISMPNTLWVGQDVRELMTLAERLPSRWILKPNSSSGRVMAIDSQHQPVDWPALIHAGDQWMQADEQVRAFGHWGYSQARSLLVAEERIGDGDALPADFRAHCHSGVIKRIDYSIGYGTPAHSVACYEGDLVTRISPHFPIEIPMTENTPVSDLTEPQRNSIISAILAIAQPFEYLRIDGYISGGIYSFGELTAYATGGVGPVGKLRDFDYKSGSYWHLPDLSAPDPREAEWRALLQGTPKGTLQT